MAFRPFAGDGRAVDSAPPTAPGAGEVAP